MPLLVVLPLLLCAALTFASTKLSSHPQTRKRVTRNPFWKLQFFCHPLVVFLLLVLGRGSLKASLCLVPFVFNFAVEPWDLPGDVLFRACFFLHHVAPVLCAVGYLIAGSNNASRDSVISGDVARRMLGQGMLFAHAWALHTIGNLDHLQWVDKQRVFWPYMAQGFLIKWVWWAGLLNNGGSPALEALPILVQYAGRWGLYLRLQHLLGTSLPHDAFEKRKQAVEFGGFVLSFLLVYFSAAL